MSLRPAERACRPRTSVFDSRTVGTVWWWPSAVPPSRAVSRGALPLEHGEAERPVVSGEPPITENVITAHVACFVAVLAQHHRGLATENRPEVCLRDGSVRYRHPSYESGADPYRLSPRRATRSRYRSMSSRRRYSSSLRRRPTSFSRPRRDEWSLSCAFRCSVSAEIRVLITAICTSAEPVSASERRCDWMISAFWVFVSVMTSGKATRRSPSDAQRAGRFTDPTLSRGRRCHGSAGRLHRSLRRGRRASRTEPPAEGMPRTPPTSPVRRGRRRSPIDRTPRGVVPCRTSDSFLRR